MRRKLWHRFIVGKEVVAGDEPVAGVERSPVVLVPCSEPTELLYATPTLRARIHAARNVGGVESLICLVALHSVPLRGDSAQATV